MKNNNSTWHSEILPAESTAVLNELHKKISLSQFYLAGGTGLALILGHRLSNDFDFFNKELFNEEVLLQNLQGLKNLSVISKEEHTLHINLNGIKVSFLGYNYPLLFPVKQYKFEKELSINVADERDIACMKISAIGSRGIKRDFIDLYMTAQKYSLSELFKLFVKKFSLTPYNNVHILKSLTYFEDANKEPMPEMLVTLKWEKIKQYFNSEVSQLL